MVVIAHDISLFYWMAYLFFPSSCMNALSWATIGTRGKAQLDKSLLTDSHGTHSRYLPCLPARHGDVSLLQPLPCVCGTHIWKNFSHTFDPVLDLEGRLRFAEPSVSFSQLSFSQADIKWQNRIIHTSTLVYINIYIYILE